MIQNKVITSSYLTSLLSDLNIPKDHIIFLHVKLRDIKSNIDDDYSNIASFLLKNIEYLYQPKTVLIPSFTYSFTKSGIYHVLFSKSETGRFSEEVRLNIVKYRTPDPIFSVLDTANYLSRININYKTAFNEGGLFDFLNNEDAIIVNIGLDGFWATQTHYIENKNKVDYRYHKIFRGVIYYNYNQWANVKYNYFVRDLSINPSYNLLKREKYLQQTGSLKIYCKDKIKISWISAQSLMKHITNKLKEDIRYLIT